MNRILVTGGRGFIGTRLTHELRSRGHDVWTCDLLAGDDPQHVRADVTAYEQLDGLVRRSHFDYVYHLAAEYGRQNGEDHYANLWRTLAIGTKHLLCLQERHRYRMVYFSSAEVYGDYDGVMTEDVMERVPIRQMNDYAIAKWAGEQQCLNSADKFGTEIVRVRPVGCYGPGEPYHPHRGVIPVFVYRALTDRSLTVHQGHTRVFDYVDDTCRTFANIVDGFKPGEVYNVAGPQEWAIGTAPLAELVVELTGASPGLLEYQQQEAFTTRIKIVDSSKAERDLGHAPTVDLRDGLVRYIAWMRRRYRATSAVEGDLFDGTVANREGQP